MRNKSLTISLIILLIISLTGCSANEVNKNPDTVEYSRSNSPVEPTKKVKEKKEEIDDVLIRIEKMSLKEKVGQLLIVGFEGQTINVQIETLIDDYKVGGFIFFERNIKNTDQAFKLINDIKTKNQTNKIPLFMSIDEESGRVSRLPSEYHKLPSAKTIGNIDKKDLSFEFGRILGERLKSLGFNLNYAPVLDINSNPDNPVIGARAYGNQEDTVTRNGIATSDGIKETNIISVVKHFPGHGDTSMDSHFNIPIIHKPKEEMDKLEFKPFKKAIEAGIDAVMVGHILFDQIDNEFPATMSKIIITNILRNELAFDGVVFTDDMTMGAIVKNYSIEAASVKFLEAGGDVLLIGHGQANPQKVFNAIEKALESNVISESELNEKVYRIISLKEKYSLNDNALVDFNIDKLNTDTIALLNEIKTSN